jgi:hypothetical protein
MAPLAIDSTNNGIQTHTMTVTNAAATITLNTLTYNPKTYVGCYTFTNYEVDQVTTPIIPPIPITATYPTVNIPATSAGAIGAVASKVYTVKIKATVQA